jgi:hypothetical protein
MHPRDDPQVSHESSDSGLRHDPMPARAESGNSAGGSGDKRKFPRRREPQHVCRSPEQGLVETCSARAHGERR